MHTRSQVCFVLKWPITPQCTISSQHHSMNDYLHSHSFNNVDKANPSPCNWKIKIDIQLIYREATDRGQYILMCRLRITRVRLIKRIATWWLWLTYFSSWWPSGHSEWTHKTKQAGHIFTWVERLWCTLHRTLCDFRPLFPANTAFFEFFTYCLIGPLPEISNDYCVWLIQAAGFV